MARLARVIAVGEPHHIVHRGVRRQNVFILPEDKAKYLSILKLQAELFGLKIWAYCLMDNHVHLIVVPETEKSLPQAIAETHKLYTRLINFREGCRGHLWEGRYRSTVMDERYVYAAVRYVERNPVRANIVQRAEEYQWSSAKAHTRRIHAPILTPFYLMDEIKNWSKYLAEEERELSIIRKHSRTGRPLGSAEYIRQLEKQMGRRLLKQKPGPVAK